MRRIAAIALLLAPPLLAGCIYEHHGRGTVTQSVSENPDGTKMVTRTEVIREAVYPAVNTSFWWGYPYYPYYPYYYYRPYPYYCHPPHHHHH
jgi:hypothetical protein